MLPDYPPYFWLAAITAVLIVGIAKAGFGGGIGFVATPLIALTISVADAAALLLPLLIIIDFLSIRHYRGDLRQAELETAAAQRHRGHHPRRALVQRPARQ